MRTAFDGRTGLDLAKVWEPDLVVTDIDMPFLNGIEAAPEMRSTRRAGRLLRLIAATGNTAWRSDPMA